MLSMINWLRANATLGGATTLFGATNQPTYNNIEQGALGDCYFLSSCAAVAENATRLESAFLTKTYNSAGIFALKVFVRGRPYQVVVDDFLPFYFNGIQQALIFDHLASGAGIWGPILEKAWAKVSGTYDITSGGWMNEAVDFLTGAPSNSWTNTDPSTINSIGVNAWNIVQPGMLANYIMTTDVGGAGCDTSDDNAYHLPCGHAYTLLGAYAILDTSGNIAHRLLRIRNPWGVDAGYNGTWNDGDTVSWTAAAQAQVPFVNNTNDGVFWIEDKDYVQAFNGFMISYYHDGWAHSYVEVLNDTAAPQRTFTFTLTTAQEIYVGMEFYDSRMYALNCKPSTTGIMYLLSGSSELGGTYTYDWNDFNYFHFTTLAAGTYTVLF